MMQQLLEQLCAIIETQNDLIRDLATRLNERDDVDLAERIAAADAQRDAVLGTKSAAFTDQKPRQGETET